jgi:peroxiredoxin
MRVAFTGFALLLAAAYGPSRASDVNGRNDRPGIPAPRIGLDHWLHSKPLEMGQLRGKVVLLRWWTEGCPFCAATAPALRELDRKYGSRGLTVIGVFHPKPPGDRSLERARLASDLLGFTFPVALDADWTALGRWWPDLERRGWTSVSFVVDKSGIIRYVHPGGEFHSARRDEESHARCDRDYRDIEQTIVRLLQQ